MIRCHGESLQSIRKSLLSSLNLQVEPQLPAGWLDVVREQWKSSFSSIAPIASDAAGTWNLKHRKVCRSPRQKSNPPSSNFVLPVPAVSGYSDGGNSTNLTCCSVASEIFMRGMQQCKSKSTYIWRNIAKHVKSVLMFTRSGMGQLGGPSCWPHHCSLCTLRP